MNALIKFIDNSTLLIEDISEEDFIDRIKEAASSNHKFMYTHADDKHFHFINTLLIKDIEFVKNKK